MRQDYVLNRANPTLVITTTFDTTALVVTNPTGSPIFVCIGAPHTPDASNADEIVPAAKAKVITCNNRTFCVTFSDPTLLVNASSANSGLFSRASINALDSSEQIPNLGSYDFQTLSISSLIPVTAFSGATSSPILDLGPWGGILVYVNPTTSSGMGAISVTVSDDGVTFSLLQLWSFWPGLPAVMTIPRVARYAQISLVPSGIPGDPGIVGTYSARATIAEVVQLTYTPVGRFVTKSFTLLTGAFQQFTFLTMGLAEITIDMLAAAGTGVRIIAERQGPGGFGTWVELFRRDQNIASGPPSGGLSFHQSIGDPGFYIRITISDLGGGSSGQISASIENVYDASNNLRQILQALGDPTAPVNANQSVYHELENIRIAVLGGNVTTGTYLPDLAGILTNTSNTSTNTSNTSTNTSNINTSLNGNANVFGNSGIAAAPVGTWINVGTIGGRIVAAQGALSPSGVGLAGIAIAYGTPATPQVVFYSTYLQTTINGQPCVGVGPVMNYESVKGAGVNPFTSTTLWVQSIGAVSGTASIMVSWV